MFQAAIVPIKQLKRREDKAACEDERLFAGVQECAAIGCKALKLRIIEERRSKSRQNKGDAETSAGRRAHL